MTRLTLQDLAPSGASLTWTTFKLWTTVCARSGDADSHECLRDGLIEEAHEALKAWHELKAFDYGVRKRARRGDPVTDVPAKRLALVHKLNLEIGDILWYAARLSHVEQYTWEPSAFEVRRPHWLTEELDESLLDSRTAEGKFTLSTDVLIEWIVAPALALTDMGLTELMELNREKLLGRRESGTILGSGDR